MPRFFFNLYDDLDVLDEEGQELPDLEALEALGVQYARSIAADQVLGGKLVLSSRIEITDETGKVVKTIRFADTIEIEHS